MPYFLVLSQEANLVKGVLNEQFLLYLIQKSVRFLLSLWLKSPLRISPGRKK